MFNLKKKLVQNLRNFQSLPSQHFVQQSAVPPNTRDLCRLEQWPRHYVFDWRNDVKNDCLFKLAVTSQRFFMWLQNHEENTPPLVFREQVTDRMCPRARLRGKLHEVSVADIVALDKQLGNGVQSERKLTRVLIPEMYRVDSHSDEYSPPKFFSRNYGLSYRGMLLETSAWVYCDKADIWRPRFDFDFQIWRGRRDTAYVPADVFKDNDPDINSYFTPMSYRAHQPRAGFHFRKDNDDFRIKMAAEEDVYNALCRQKSSTEKGVQPVKNRDETPPQIT
jgi:hypothetical protein